MDQITKSWRSDRHKDAKALRDNEATKLAEDGWIVEPYEVEVTGRPFASHGPAADYTTYGFTANRPE